MSAPFMLPLLALALAAAVPLKAQTALCISHNDQFYVVFKVLDGQPYVMEKGKLTPVLPNNCILAPVEEFRPAFVSVRIIKVESSSVNVINKMDSINQGFHFDADFTSPYRLKDVFFALEMTASEMGRTVFYFDVGDLEPGIPHNVDVNLHLRVAVGPGSFKVHVFSEGAEVFNSQQPWQYREGMLDKMVGKRIAGVQDAPLQPFFGPGPEYPAALKKAGIKGKAVVSVRVAGNGRVQDPVVESATDPAFGEAALAAVRMWRFLPKVVRGFPVETNASVPFVF